MTSSFLNDRPERERRALAQSLAREFGPQGIHIAHIIVDGFINTERVRSMAPDRKEHTMLKPEAIAEMYW